jgi:hypothetical protein
VSPADADVAVATPAGADAEGAEEEAAQQEAADAGAAAAAAGDAGELDDSGAHECARGMRTALIPRQLCRKSECTFPDEELQPLPTPMPRACMRCADSVSETHSARPHRFAASLPLANRRAHM